MALEIKSTDDPRSMELHDETGRVGLLFYVGPDEGDPDDSAVGWVARVHGFAYSGSQETKFCNSAPEAFAEALPLYDQVLEQRRTAERFHKNQPVHMISTPMGGQPR
ncbi:hypothetical protein [Streptomyces sp. NRRL S-350]|uniref:hypothetical protein n=1 Tax=Streptomyces sp. NRRL S-350 TaxID=1463902 RepID=UPI0004C197DE|nr:hypothetical protein [Streptomyces sp. NRRL S-350]